MKQYDLLLLGISKLAFDNPEPVKFIYKMKQCDLLLLGISKLAFSLSSFITPTPMASLIIDFFPRVMELSASACTFSLSQMSTASGSNVCAQKDI